MGETPVKVSVTSKRLRKGCRERGRDARLQIPELVAPLCQNPESVLVECDDDEEATDGREVGSEGL